MTLPRGGKVRDNAILVQDGPQEPESVILPLLLCAAGMQELTEIAQIEPKDFRAALGLKPGTEEIEHLATSR
jgi:hypothetical protein